MASTSAQKIKFSASTDGKAIKVAATATAGTLIHTATSETTAGNFDEIWLYAFNSDASPVTLTIEFGDASAPDSNIVVDIDGMAGLTPIVPGLILQNAATVKAFASSANKITISGFVNRITYA